jgi:hypothetical protein
MGPVGLVLYVVLHAVLNASNVLSWLIGRIPAMFKLVVMALNPS